LKFGAALKRAGNRAQPVTLLSPQPCQAPHRVRGIGKAAKAQRDPWQS